MASSSFTKSFVSTIMYGLCGGYCHPIDGQERYSGHISGADPLKEFVRSNHLDMGEIDEQILEHMEGRDESFSRASFYRRIDAGDEERCREDDGEIVDFSFSSMSKEIPPQMQRLDSDEKSHISVNRTDDFFPFHQEDIHEARFQVEMKQDSSLDSQFRESS